MKSYFYFFIFLFVAGCTSPMKWIENKDYDRAYQLALRKLKSGKDKDKTIYQEILNQALVAIAAKEVTEMQRLEASEDEKDWDKALKLNEKLQTKYAESSAYINSENHANYEALILRQTTLKAEMADYYYERAMADWERFYETDLKINAQKAYLNLAKIEHYSSTYRTDLDSLLTETLEAGMMNYYIEAKTHFVFELSEWEVDEVFDDLERNSGGFERVHFERDLANIDCSITIKIQDLDIDLDEDQETRSYEQRVEDGYDVTTDTSGQEIRTPRYIEVEALVTTITYRKTATLEAVVTVNGVTKNCMLSNERFDVQRRDEIQKMTKQGDDRALPSSFSENRRAELQDDDDMAEELLQELFEEVRRYYF